MFLQYLYRQTGLNHFHSTDLADMRRALLDEDQNGPDGGSTDATARLAPPRRLNRNGIARRPQSPTRRSGGV